MVVKGYRPWHEYKFVWTSCEIEVFFQKSAVNGIIAYYGDSQGIHAD